ncbi:NADH:ubiquinone reductase (Na(+)-transporting) subunit B [Pseudoprevotella muciniphila]|uniref:Na(+)-translocating NADH-quinone reductase subunit B n=1 Tax=Pseudoprevotella muciniphila TaxID=2133944 RepID=A0A5P8E4F4_9BACT|nr:NADH:ubiquinone reductase (Na(+)-transporting) subunit B [Pseudoprevotella muciniphila]QFQ11804.1 NADH:ubiquinone reductase (Na(+)-transporting) subunit B [Pseudoprevotella muciniphila]
MIKKLFDKIRPNFEEGGKLKSFHSVFEGFESFLLVPNTTSKSGVSIHDAIDSKRIMSFVVIALLPALFFGMYNIGLQNYTLAGQSASWFTYFLYGFLVMLPRIVVSYAVGLGIEFVVAQWKKEEIQEGYLVTGLLIPMILPVNTPLWMMALAVAFSVIFAKEIYGGTGMNIFNPALVARAFLFFAYPTSMSGDKVWVCDSQFFGLGNALPDTMTQATALGEAAADQAVSGDFWQYVVGTMPGSVGETSVIAIAIGALILLWTRIASWKTMSSVFVGGAIVAFLFNVSGLDSNEVAKIPWYNHLVLGGFAFGAVFMATDPVTSARTEKGKYIYGFLIGALAIVIRVLNPGYPEGMMLAILFMNMFAPLIDYCFVQKNISKRAKRMKVNND